jgi:3'(2'), 5'-bisphosphate nucleotidase
MQELAQKVMEIARDAGNAILSIYNDQPAWEVEQKADNSPLTLADRKSNAVICAGLEALEAPHQYPIISEENKEIPYEERKDYDRYWLVDPLDGTKEFIKRNGDFTVNIALIENGAPILGVVYIPVSYEMYWAGKGHGAYRIIDGNIKKLAASTFQMYDPGLNLVCSRSHLNDDTANYLKQFNEPELVSRGSSLKFLIIATGQAHIYPRLAPTMEWDTGAAQIVLEEAGGKVLQWNSDEALAYNKENLLNPYFIAFGNVQD